MPPKLTRVSGAAAIRALERLGFVRTRQQGSHVIMRKQTAEGSLMCVVPLHRKPIPIGTLHSMLRQADLTPEEFLEHL